ncbi:MAG: hypothetical protein ACKVZH_09130 [Blastocatellia bacterium]
MSNKSKLAVGAAVVALSLLLLAAVVTVSGQSSREKEKDASAQTQWEYMVVNGGTVNLTGVSDLGRKKQPDNSFREMSVLQRNLDKLGQNGWELVSVYGLPADPVYFLKRPRESR